MVNDNTLILLIVLCFSAGMIVGYLIGRRFPS